MEETVKNKKKEQEGAKKLKCTALRKPCQCSVVEKHLIVIMQNIFLNLKICNQTKTMIHMLHHNNTYLD